MEAFRELERVQKMVSSMHAHDNNDSTRFLADFFLFIVKPYGTLDMKKKFTLISEITPKISPDFLQEEQVLFSCDGQDEQFSSRYLTEHCVNNESNLSKREEMPMVGLDAMQRANSTLEDFCRSYFMFHGMDVNKPESVFRHLPVLSFTESYIYQLDSFNEELVNISGKISVGNTSNTEKNEKLADHIVKTFQTGALRPLIFVLERHGLMTDRIRVELSFGEEYWALERKLCHALVSRKKISIEDVMRAIHLKSFDYRVLSLLLYQLKETQVNEMHMDFLSISEFLVEVSDDLFDYEDDVIDNNFNILRMFVGVYGASVAPMMLAKYITEAEEKYENLSKTLDPDLFINYMRRCEEATKEGGSGAGHSLGTWSIPPVIANEDFYRSERLTSN